MNKFVQWFQKIGQKVNNSKLGAFFKNWQDAGSVLPPAVKGVTESLLNKYTDAGATGRDVAINQMNRQNVVDQASLEVEGYKKAGLNPALMYGSGTSSAPSVSNTSAGGLQDLVSLFSLPYALRQMKAQIDATKASADNTRADTDLKRADTDLKRTQSRVYDLDRQFLENTLKDRVEQVSQNVHLTKEQIGEISDKRNLLKQQLETEKANTKNVEEHWFVEHWSAKLNQASAEQIAALLPYEIAFKKAATQAQRAAAAASFTHAAYEQGLIDAGFIDAQVQQALNSAKVNERLAEGSSNLLRN